MRSIFTLSPLQHVVTYIFLRTFAYVKVQRSFGALSLPSPLPYRVKGRSQAFSELVSDKVKQWSNSGPIRMKEKIIFYTSFWFTCKIKVCLIHCLNMDSRGCWLFGYLHQVCILIDDPTDKLESKFGNPFSTFTGNILLYWIQCIPDCLLLFPRRSHQNSWSTVICIAYRPADCVLVFPGKSHQSSWSTIVWFA